MNVSRGRAARRDMREGSSRSLGREGSVSAQSLWKRVREGGIRGLDMFVADATYELAVLEKQGEEAGDERRRRMRQAMTCNATLGAPQICSGIVTALRFKNVAWSAKGGHVWNF